MDSSLDTTTLSTISLLESRLLRIEHLLYGPTAAPPSLNADSAVDGLEDLERRFNHLLSRIRVYGELMKISSSLTSVNDCPIPEPSQSASLASLVPRMRGIEATQIAQEAEMAQLRERSEEVLKNWYQQGVLGASEFVADVEGRVERAERRVRRAEREKEEAAAI
ncbi:hypothetical protein COL154_003903 [Colletotrichum chrysophilum]|nr:hypothetical protein K4K54_007574 [Colletotrichum sp. SAR 10_86]KAJ0366314.1 hypothetical protein COL154_003903 [Colletotrichum chrysophilum]